MSGWPAPRRNFSPWYQVVSRLMATEETDGLPEDPVDFEPWSDRFRSRLDATLAPWPVRVPLDVEVTEEVSVDGYRRSRRLVSDRNMAARATSASLSCRARRSRSRWNPRPAE